MQVFLKPFAGIDLFSMIVRGFRHAGGSEKTDHSFYTINDGRFIPVA